MKGYTFADYINIRLEARIKAIQAVNNNQDHKSQNEGFNALTMAELTNMASQIAKSTEKTGSVHEISAPKDFDSGYRAAQFTVFTLYADYIEWLIQKNNDKDAGPLYFTIGELLYQIQVINAYQIHVLKQHVASQKSQSATVFAPAVPEDIANQPRSSNDFNSIFWQNTYLLHSAVDGAVLDAANAYYKKLCFALSFMGLVAAGGLLAIACLVEMHLIGSIFLGMMGVLGIIGAGNYSLYFAGALLCGDKLLDTPEPTYPIEPDEDNNFNPPASQIYWAINRDPGFHNAKRAAEDRVLREYDVSRLATALIKEIAVKDQPANGLDTVIKAETKYMFMSWYPRKYGPKIAKQEEQRKLMNQQLRSLTHALK